MLRAVLDANVYVSALLQPDGPPGRIVDRYLREGTFQVVLSAPIAEEVLQTLAYPKIRKHLRAAIVPELWLEDLLVLAELVAPGSNLSGVCEDPDDDKYLAAALDGRAGFVVTGDQRFLALKEYGRVQIVTPRAFLAILRSEAAGGS